MCMYPTYTRRVGLKTIVTSIQKAQKTAQSKNDVVTQLLEPFETPDTRIAYYNLVKEYLQNTANEYCLIKDDNDTYHIDNFLKLIKPIGSGGIYGIIYESITDDNKLMLITKLMLSRVKENINEVSMNEFATEIFKRKLSKHFLLSYKTFKCVVPKNIEDAQIKKEKEIEKQKKEALKKEAKKYGEKPKELPVKLYSLSELIHNKGYYLALNELAHGDVKMLLLDDTFLSDSNNVFNILVQCMLAIATIHSFGLIHNDTHSGNFLFHFNPHFKKGYYHYIIYDKDYYLQSSAFNIMIYDFGRIQPWKLIDENSAIEDYRYIMGSFMLKQHESKSWPSFHGLIDTTDTNAKKLYNLSIFVQDLHTKLLRENQTSIELKKEPVVIDTILNLIMRLSYNQSILMQSIPDNAEILNDIPYIINNDNAKNYKSIIPSLLRL